MRKESILITGATGQIGTVLTTALRKQYGERHVLATDIRKPVDSQGQFEVLNVLDKDQMLAIVRRFGITQIYHLAAILSAKGEENPRNTWDINMSGLFNVLDMSREAGVSKIFFPSSIAVFGLETPRQHTPQFTVLTPTTVYGISKVAGENWCNYYHKKYGTDVRSVRYPGIIGYQSLPGGGTTDYAVDIYHKAVRQEEFSCFLTADTRLPMIYMDDAIRGTIELMEAPAEMVKIRTSYNLAGMDFTPAEIAQSISLHFPKFRISYNPDPLRQAIAESWPESIDDSAAREDWGWEPKFDLATMTTDMISNLERYYLAAEKIG
jgi:nucleoside-diphosphate-sugar epimerase